MTGSTPVGAGEGNKGVSGMETNKEYTHSEHEVPSEDLHTQKVRFEVYGEEMIEKVVRASGNSGRIYIPPDWVGHKVKIIKVD
ncbi:MAG: DUF2080 family transposase-associated protein [Desulfovermiculus sp.]